MASILGTSSAEIARAADVLRGGGLVAFPTETVYGVGARAADARAVARVFAAKGRPADHPLIVHLSGPEELDRWAREIPAAARELGAHFWPGPLTLILKHSPGVPDTVTGGQDTIGLRVPAHPVALALLEAVGGGLAAPSANRYGRVSPTTAAHVLAELGDDIDGVIDGGACSVGLESTILDLSGPRPRILRPGVVTAEAVAEVLGVAPERGGRDAPRVPGSTAAHYAPGIPLRLVEAAAIEREARARPPLERPVAVLAMREPLVELLDSRWWLMPTDPEGYGRVLYARLREAEGVGCRSILVERPPPAAGWDAVRDRLARAAAGTGTTPDEGEES